MDDAEHLRALKMTHNALNQRATAVLALAEVVQDYRTLATQLLAHNEKLQHDLANCRQAKMGIPEVPPRAP